MRRIFIYAFLPLSALITGCAHLPEQKASGRDIAATDICEELFSGEAITIHPVIVELEAYWEASPQVKANILANNRQIALSSRNQFIKKFFMEPYGINEVNPVKKFLDTPEIKKQIKLLIQASVDLTAEKAFELRSDIVDVLSHEGDTLADWDRLIMEVFNDPRFGEVAAGPQVENGPGNEPPLDLKIFEQIVSLANGKNWNRIDSPNYEKVLGIFNYGQQVFSRKRDLDSYTYLSQLLQSQFRPKYPPY